MFLPFWKKLLLAITTIPNPHSQYSGMSLTEIDSSACLIGLRMQKINWILLCLS